MKQNVACILQKMRNFIFREFTLLAFQANFRVLVLVLGIAAIPKKISSIVKKNSL